MPQTDTDREYCSGNDSSLNGSRINHWQPQLQCGNAALTPIMTLHHHGVRRGGREKD